MVVRTGQESTPALSGGSSWEQGLYERVLGSITDQRVPRQPDPTTPNPETPDADRGFQTAVFNPGQYLPGVAQPALPPAGPRRARAMQMTPVRSRASRRGVVTVRLPAPPLARRTAAGAAGRATLRGRAGGAQLRHRTGRGPAASFRLTSGAARLAQAPRQAAAGARAPTTATRSTARRPPRAWAWSGRRSPRGWALLSRLLAVRRGRVRIRLACPRRGDTGCRGRHRAALARAAADRARAGSGCGKGRRAVLRMRVRRGAAAGVAWRRRRRCAAATRALARRRVRIVR